MAVGVYVVPECQVSQPPADILDLRLATVVNYRLVTVMTLCFPVEKKQMMMFVFIAKFFRKQRCLMHLTILSGLIFYTKNVALSRIENVRAY
jgi:hypothetical protein